MKIHKIVALYDIIDQGLYIKGLQTSTGEYNNLLAIFVKLKGE